MKNLTATVALLVCAFTPIVFAQTVEIIRGTERDYQNVSTPSTFAQSAEQVEQQKVFTAWREKVRGAEREYKNKHGRYGDLAALRKARLLPGLVFESCSSQGASRKAKANFVPNSTLIQVPVSEDGQHFDVTIVDGPGRCSPPVYILPGTMRDFQDSPEGLIFAR